MAVNAIVLQDLFQSGGEMILAYDDDPFVDGVFGHQVGQLKCRVKHHEDVSRVFVYANGSPKLYIRGQLISWIVGW